MFPKDGRTAFGTNDGIIGVFEHEDAVCDADTEGASGAALAYDDGNRGGSEGHHFPQVEGDGLGDMSFLGAHARVGPRSVDERDKGEPEFFAHTHEAKRLAIAFGVGAAEVSPEIFLSVTALLMADDGALVFADGGKPPGHGGVVPKQAVSVQFHEIRKRQLHVIQGEGTRRVARDLDSLPGGEFGVNLVPGLLEFLLQLRRLCFDVDVTGGGTASEIGKFRFQFEDRFFKLEGLQLHRIT